MRHWRGERIDFLFPFARSLFFFFAMVGEGGEGGMRGSFSRPKNATAALKPLEDLVLPHNNISSQGLVILYLKHSTAKQRAATTDFFFIFSFCHARPHIDTVFTTMKLLTQQKHQTIDQTFKSERRARLTCWTHVHSTFLCVIIPHGCMFGLVHMTSAGTSQCLCPLNPCIDYQTRSPMLPPWKSQPLWMSRQAGASTTRLLSPLIQSVHHEFSTDRNQ